MPPFVDRTLLSRHVGRLRSGDYTPTNLAWLGAVAGKISDRLLALDPTAVA